MAELYAGILSFVRSNEFYSVIIQLILFKLEYCCYELNADGLSMSAKVTKKHFHYTWLCYGYPVLLITLTITSSLLKVVHMVFETIMVTRMDFLVRISVEDE